MVSSEAFDTVEIDATFGLQLATAQSCAGLRPKHAAPRTPIGHLMIIAFTICSANYLPQALTLADSLARHAPAWKFVIGLVDDPASVLQFTIPPSVEVIDVASIGLANLKTMANLYNIIELCTAVKPSYFKAILDRYSDSEQVHYLDPDTVMFSSPQSIEEALTEAAISLTPHHFTPLPLDGQFPGENLGLNHGIYNLGYLGIRRSPSAARMLDWWEALLAEHCRIDLAEGWFVDQLPMNYVPLYFDDVMILRHPGVNTAYWNLHERRIMPDGAIEFDGRSWPLVLFHFSSFVPLQPTRITKHRVRLDELANPGLPELLTDYAQRLLANGWANSRSLVSTYQFEYRYRQAIAARRQRNPARRMAAKIRRMF